MLTPPPTRPNDDVFTAEIAENAETLQQSFSLRHSAPSAVHYEYSIQRPPEKFRDDPFYPQYPCSSIAAIKRLLPRIQPFALSPSNLSTKFIREHPPHPRCPRANVVDPSGQPERQQVVTRNRRQSVFSIVPTKRLLPTTQDIQGGAAGETGMGN